ncbi:MAG: L-rhamnose mutarotase [Luteolibacter sp.]
MRLIPVIISTLLLLGAPLGYARSPQAADPHLPTNATRLMTGVRRHTSIVEIKTGRMDACRKLFAAVPEEVGALYHRVRIRNMTRYLKELGGKPYLITYFEYVGSDFAGDIARIEAAEAMKNWRKSVEELLVSPQARVWEDVEEVFYTEGAAGVLPVPEKYARIGMITGLKPEKEAEYRTLHATTWPGVLKGIRDCNYRNFTIRLAEVDGNLFLIGYLEYVGRDPAADAAAGKALPVNKRWWKFTDACQKPLPAAEAKGEIWDGLEEIQHLD